MTRLPVLGVALVFIAGFAFLTFAAVVEEGFTLASAAVRAASSCCLPWGSSARCAILPGDLMHASTFLQPPARR